MPGINRALSTITLAERAQRKSRQIFCVFLSHQKSDASIAKAVAEYLINANIDVYFDEYDNDLRIARESNNPKEVTASIQKGIEFSSHMLCIVSANTLLSRWVPFEVGYGYDKTQLAVLLAKNVKKEDVPDYVRAAPTLIPDIDDLNGLIAKLRGTTKEALILEGRVKAHNNVYNPLANYVEPFRTI